MNAPPPQTVFLTGFGPFPGVPENVSEDIARAVAEKARHAFPKTRFETAILPVTWQGGPEALLAELDRLKPDIAIHFGVAASATGFQLETAARNHCRLADDATGCHPPALRISADGPNARSTSLPLDSIVAALTRLGLPVALSDDAGGYLCNATLYHSLAHAETAARARPTGFVHIPVALRGEPLDFEQALAGGFEIVRCTIESLAVIQASPVASSAAPCR